MNNVYIYIMPSIRCKIHLDQNIQSNVCHFLEIFSISTTVFPIQNAVLCFRWFCCVPVFVWGILTSDHEHSMELTYPTKQKKENHLQISLGWGYVSSQQGIYIYIRIYSCNPSISIKIYLLTEAWPSSFCNRLGSGG